MKEVTFDVTDRISQLPEEILQHILSFLVVRDVFLVSLLSKRWYNACRTFPSLDFSKNFFPEASLDKAEREIRLNKTQELLNVIDHIIRSRLRQGGSLQKFRLLLPERLYHLLDLRSCSTRWIGYIAPIVHGNIEEFALTLGELPEGYGYTLPEAVFAAKSLTKLYLGGFKMDLPMNGVKFSGLRELYLSSNYLDNQLLQLLITSCPNIEVLELIECYGFDILQIIGLCQLKKLHFYSEQENIKKIEIDAPNLQHLFLCPLWKVAVFNVTASKRLKTAILHYLPISQMEDEFFSKFPLLEAVDLRGCEQLENLKISSNYLKTLLVMDCVKLLQVEIDAPNLSSFTYSGSASLSFSWKVLAVQNIKFIPKVDSWSTQSQKDLIQLLGNFNQSEAMNFSIRCLNRVYIGEKVRECFQPPLYDLKHLSLSGLCVAFNCSFDNLLDSLLWIAPHLDTLSFSGDFAANLELIYENDKDEARCPFCRFLPINCWRCSLKRVRVVRRICSEVAERKLKEYLRKNAKILASVDFV